LSFGKRFCPGQRFAVLLQDRRDLGSICDGGFRSVGSIASLLAVPAFLEDSQPSLSNFGFDISGFLLHFYVEPCLEVGISESSCAVIVTEKAAEIDLMNVVAIGIVFGAAQVDSEGTVGPADFEVDPKEVCANGVEADVATGPRAADLHAGLLEAENALAVLQFVVHHHRQKFLGCDARFELDVIVSDLHCMRGGVTEVEEHKAGDVVEAMLDSFHGEIEFMAEMAARFLGLSGSAFPVGGI
jgi:hypothetical protein